MDPPEHAAINYGELHIHNGMNVVRFSGHQNCDRRRRARFLLSRQREGSSISKNTPLVHHHHHRRHRTIGRTDIRFISLATVGLWW